MYNKTSTFISTKKNRNPERKNYLSMNSSYEHVQYHTSHLFFNKIYKEHKNNINSYKTRRKIGMLSTGTCITFTDVCFLDIPP